jgi:glutamyl-tRNA synthetase
MKKIRLRFAPSPTGFVHIGSLRTILFDYLLSKHLKGDLVLRLEDTDKSRQIEGSLDNLLEICEWLGIEFDEGPHKEKEKYAPYIQSQRLEVYKKYTQELIEKEAVYYCFCTKERLEEMRNEQIINKAAPKYDRKCRDLGKIEIAKKLKQKIPYVIRQKMPKEGEIKVFDELRGEINFKASELEDQILMKSDNMPTYQLASVIDDHLMEISHVSRGEEWIPSLPKNILLYQAFNWKAPKFIHFPLILNKNGGKLSKRQGDVFVEDYKKQGYLPEALINFCVLLGWHLKDDREIFSLKELENIFTLKDLRTSPAIFDLDKLQHFNAHYLRKKTDEQLYNLAKNYLIRDKLIKTKPSEEEKNKCLKLMPIAKERIKTISDISLYFSFFFKSINYEKSLLIWKKLSENEVLNNLKELLNLLENINDWQLNNLENEVINYLKKNEKKNGDYLWPLRVALSGQKFSPGPFENAWILGKDESIKRIKQAINLLS